jgi:hypothetical protein
VCGRGDTEVSFERISAMSRGSVLRPISSSRDENAVTVRKSSCSLDSSTKIGAIRDECSKDLSKRCAYLP